jgi:hypothetical protein
MRKLGVALIICASAGLAALPIEAAELRVTGFFHTIYRFESNTSSEDDDMTRNSDQASFGRHRSRFFFDFVASDDLRGIFAIELDFAVGAPVIDRFGARCIRGTGLFAFEQCGFRNAIDVNNFELKNLYVDFRIPQIPIGNRFRIGGPPINVSPLGGRFLYAMDAGGGQAIFDFTDEIGLLLTYVQLEEDLDRFPGSTKIGEDYIAGATLMLKPLPGLDFHILGVYYHGQAPFGPALTGGGGPFNAIRADSTNVRTESRYYVGFDARYRLGNLSILPTFVYLLGDRKLGATALRPADEIDFNGLEARLRLEYSVGRWRVGAQGTYSSGNAANDDINNRGTPSTRRADVGFRPLGVDGTHIWYFPYFEILGGSLWSSAGQSIGPVSPGERGTFDRFGVIQGAGDVEYRVTDRLRLLGAVGAMFTPKRPGCPAVLQISPTVCAVPELNFSGASRYIGTEVNVRLDYTVMRGLRLIPGFAYAFLGDAWGIRENGVDRKAQDAWVFGTQLRYDF